jgi:hypothetical protein
MMNKQCLATFLLAALSAACGDDKPELTTPDASMPDSPPSACAVTPGAWSAPDFATNAAEALALRAQLDLLVGASTMEGAEKGTAPDIDEVSDLEAVYNGGTPAFSSKVHATMDAVIGDAFPEFIAIIAAGPKDLVGTGWDPGEHGGIYGARKAGINAGGIEIRQIVDKGLFAGGALYPYALKLTEDTLTPATIDAIAAAWGSNATLDSTQGVRTDSANYSFGMGFHADMAQLLTDAKAYAADSKCTTERDTAIVTFFRKWEQSMIARGFFYANGLDTGLATAGTNDDMLANALHAYSEGLGLIIGFYGAPSPTSGPLANNGRTITDADIAAILTELKVNRTDLNASTIGEFIDDSSLVAPAIANVATKLKQVYGVTDTVIAKWKDPGTGG